ncbi:hypothetical protein NDU88_000128 [Pleurodeles waltl]|uniref:Uncharacterized protein n=1 Tax=Pleurodeles waltl TaxID=8319 RepID=A0AAV7KP39_PLEWA|nr:hypothetical protein NDU88_000128 [Pleurodeles waltl]
MATGEAGCAWSQGLLYLGAFAAAYITIRFTHGLLRGVRVYLLSSVWKNDVRKYGEWAGIYQADHVLSAADRLTANLNTDKG